MTWKLSIASHILIKVIRVHDIKKCEHKGPMNSMWTIICGYSAKKFSTLKFWELPIPDNKSTLPYFTIIL